MDSNAIVKLLEATKTDQKDDPIRLVLTIREVVVDSKPPDPANYESRVEYRRALIDQRKASSSATNTDELAKSFSKMGLNAVLGMLTHTIVVEGPAESLAKVLVNDDIVDAFSDDRIELIRPHRPSN